MLQLVTGVPGSGKTLWVMARVAEEARQSGRPVFYNGIKLTAEGVAKLGWHQLEDAEKWYQLGATSIVLIDEAQRHFRPRPRGAAVPDHFAQFETHRHEGIDAYLLTQNPMLIDSHVRKLVGKHFHIKRTFGMEAAKVSQWESRVAANPDKKAEYLDAREWRWKYPKDVYGWYESAEVHTHGRDLPWKHIVYVGIGCVVVLGGIWEVKRWGTSRAAEKASPAKAADVEVGPPKLFASHVRRGGNPWALEVQAARVPGAPHTAAFFDDLQIPQSQPTVAGCMELEIDHVVTCKCHTRQRSVIPMPISQCVELVRNGWFDPTAKPDDVAAENRARLDKRDAASLDEKSSAPNASGASLGAPVVAEPEHRVVADVSASSTS